MKTSSKYNWADLLVAGGFLLLGLYLLVSGSRLPSGAGFFPVVLGVVITVLSVGLLVKNLRTTTVNTFTVGNSTVLISVILLIGAYLAFWGTGWFGLRTFVLLAVMMRVLRESWRTSILVSAVLTIGVTLAFKLGLHVSLN